LNDANNAWHNGMSTAESLVLKLYFDKNDIPIYQFHQISVQLTQMTEAKHYV
jgi:hypothetical protein